MVRRSFTELETRKVNVVEVAITASQIKNILPFRVRFTNLNFGASSANSSPAIGVMVIGSSFYIL
jgi:hypothetical protein